MMTLIILKPPKTRVRVNSTEILKLLNNCTAKKRTFEIVNSNLMKTLVNDRIDIRISKEQKELIKYASDLSGFKNLTEFIIYSVNKETKNVIIENNQVLKSLEDKKIFLKAILNPPSPNNKLIKASLKYKKKMDDNGAIHPTS